MKLTLDEISIVIDSLYLTVGELHLLLGKLPEKSIETSITKKKIDLLRASIAKFEKIKAQKTSQFTQS